MMQHMMTTVDNPFDPFDEFDKWDMWDRSRGYCTLAYLSRVTTSSEDLSEGDQMLDIERAMDEVLEFDELGIYKKVSKEVEVETSLAVLVGETEASDITD